MTIRIAINGFGRIGRNVLRALYESGRRAEIAVVAINELASAEGSPTCSSMTPATDVSPGMFVRNAINCMSERIVSDCCIRPISSSCPGVSSALTWCWIAAGYMAAVKTAKRIWPRGRRRCFFAPWNARSGCHRGVRRQSSEFTSRTPYRVECILHHQLYYSHY